jgi:hypothetical protein
VALVALPKRGTECFASFGGVAALLDGFLDVRLKLFVDLAAQTIAAKGIVMRDQRDMSKHPCSLFGTQGCGGVDAHRADYGGQSGE